MTGRLQNLSIEHREIKTLVCSETESTPESNNEDNLTRIAVTAYYKAEARGYEPGHELQDWLEAEAEFSSK